MAEENLSIFDEMKKEYEAGVRDGEAGPGGASSLFGLPSEDNLIRWQLDLREDLDRIYHLLKGDQITEDADGNVKYSEATHDDLKPFNEFGVQMMMNILQFYLNRNTLLSNYTEDKIEEKVLDFGRRLNDLLHNRYEEIMMTLDLKKSVGELIGKEIKELPSGIFVTDFAYKSDGTITYNELPPAVLKWKDELKRNHMVKKLKIYEMMVGSLVDSVHSAYLRALKGGERESLRTARTVNQTEGISNQQQYGQQNMQVPQRKFSLVNPRSWVS